MRAASRLLLSCKWTTIILLLTTECMAHAQSISVGPAATSSPMMPTSSTSTPVATDPSLIFKPALPFRFAGGPENAPGLVIEFFKRLALHDKPELANSTTLQVWPPIQGYPLDIETAANHGQFQANPSQLTYLIEDSGQTVALITAGSDRTGKFYLSSLAFSYNNWQPTELVNALEKAAASDKVKQGSYEVRLLTSPTYFFLMAVWLKSIPGGTDLIFPYHISSESGLQNGKPYTVEEFLKIIQPIAKKRLDNLSKAPFGA